ncbi:hypothetical protein PTTG_25722 [Puccinia triticina 1-1 BBBD Race 1]|uniref:Uncharacterized protein n=1 Tax=Puccinia triticina (isolate 1-1 / race 1 (BBBD)) TaxID=630390 RepID=A0A180GZJ7_PUCT1|nr:hypothetical protein PTTG_25722 [Puccinia triticina 1-1 BBBD Race 1]
MFGTQRFEQLIVFFWLPNPHSTNNQVTDQFFTLTSRLDPLPFANAHGEPEESYLPSQPADSQAEGCNLFYKQSNPHRDDPASMGPIPNTTCHKPTRVAAAAPLSDSRRPPAPWIIHLNHHVYQLSAASQIAQVNPRNTTAASAKAWERVISKNKAVLKTIPQHMTWPKIIDDCIDGLDKIVPLLGAHLHRMEEQKLLKWQFIIPKNEIFAKGKNVFVLSAGQLAEFVEQALANPTAQLTIKVCMQDPQKKAKGELAARAQQDALAMSYGPDDTRLALERSQACVAVNPLADLDEQERIRIAADLHVYITGKYGANTESMRIKDPKSPGSSIRVTRDALTKWSRCMLHKIPGVDQDNPPDIPKFLKDKRPVFTLAELAMKQDARLSKHKSAASPSKSSAACASETLGQARTSGEMGSPTKGPPLASADPGVGPKTEKAGLVFTPVRISSAG